ncbi:MAG: hypothetical protein GY705_08245 [Bacteroidetes bacterium]|nr:hypothetical protein [Bacteroidota bacterium]
MIENKVEELLDQKFQEESFSDCFLIEVKQLPGNRLNVFIDSDTGVTFSKCQKISRYLESHIDSEGWLGEKYVLEVSSPGVKRPLVFPRQYPKHIGRKVEVTLTDDTMKKGSLIEVNDLGIVLETKMKIKVGKKKKTELIRSELGFDIIKKTIVKISF